MSNTVFALIGNQNCGKTTLFNQLTGSNQHVGNFPGVTVEKKEGHVRKYPNASVVDLPGIYSLSPYTNEEVVTRDFLIRGKPDCIINIVDATNIERNLYLTMQLMELSMPMVIALNMMDEIVRSGNYIDVKGLEENLGIPVVPITASRNEGVTELMDRALETAEKKILPMKIDFCTGEAHRAIHSVMHLIEESAKNASIPGRFAATRLIEGDKLIEDVLHLSKNDRETIEHIAIGLEKSLDTDREAAIADMRYSYIESICAKTVHKKNETKEQARSVKIDNILTHKYFAIPIFLVIMAAIFALTFSVIGAFLSDALEMLIDAFTASVDAFLINAGVSDILHSLIIDGIFAGVGSVLSFLPTIVTLFFFLSLLEDSGYMARVAFVMDKLLRKIGLSGRSFVPMLIGFGCSVPAIMATRTLPSERDRKMTIMLIPFMSCSAKLPIYALFTAALFEKHQGLVMIILYVGGMLCGVLSGLLLKNTVFKGEPVPFVMELPAYRLPSPKTIGLHVWGKAKDFIHKAFTVIFVATIVIWALQNFDFGFNMVTDNTQSMLAAIGSFIAPIFVPLGFGDWRVASALVTGLSAKEAVVSTLTVLSGASTAGDVAALLPGMFTPLSAFSFLVFTVLYMPCVAAFAAIRRELSSTLDASVAMVYQTTVAWLMAFIIYNIGLAIGL